MKLKRLVKWCKSYSASSEIGNQRVRNSNYATSEIASDGSIEISQDVDFLKVPITPSNVFNALKQVKDLNKEARLIVAHKLLERVKQVLNDVSNTDEIQVQAGLKMLERESELFADLQFRAKSCESSLTEWEGPDWIFGQSYMGVTTYYKKDPTNGSLWVKLTGTMEGCNVLDMLAVIRELSLYSDWMPFCSGSRLLAELGKVELLGWLEVSTPFFVRDCIIHAYACDSILEDKCVLLQGNSVDHWKNMELPEKKATWVKDRMIVHAFKSKIEMLSPTSVCTSVVANIDPKAPLPQTMINFVMRKAAGMLLYFLVKAASKIPYDAENLHRNCIRSDPDFYLNWMVPKFQRFCEMLGWTFEMPVAVLESMKMHVSYNNNVEDQHYDNDDDCIRGDESVISSLSIPFQDQMSYNDQTSKSWDRIRPRAFSLGKLSIRKRLSKILQTKKRSEFDYSEHYPPDSSQSDQKFRQTLKSNLNENSPKRDRVIGNLKDVQDFDNVRLKSNNFGKFKQNSQDFRIPVINSLHFKEKISKLGGFIIEFQRYFLTIVIYWLFGGYRLAINWTQQKDWIFRWMLVYMLQFFILSIGSIYLWAYSLKYVNQSNCVDASNMKLKYILFAVATTGLIHLTAVLPLLNYQTNDWSSWCSQLVSSTVYISITTALLTSIAVFFSKRYHAVKS